MKKLFLSTAGYAMIGCVLLTSLLTACSKTGNNSNSNTQQLSGILAFNLVPDRSAGIVIALSNSSLTQSPLLFTSYTGNYIGFTPGSVSVQAYDYTNNPITNSTYNFDNNKYYSLFVVGAANVYSNVIVQDNFDSLSSTNGQAYVRYVNAIPDSSILNVIVSVNGGEAVNDRAHFKSVSQFVPVAPGQVTVNINNTNNISSTLNITLEKQKVYTIVMTGLPGSTDSTTAVKINAIANVSLGQ